MPRSYTAHSSEVAAGAAGVASFGMGLFTQLCQEQPQAPVVFFSPVSAAAALALAVAGVTTAGPGEAELQRALGASPKQVAALGQALLSAGGAGTGVALRVASAAYTKASILHEYMELVQKVHGAQAEAFPTTYAPPPRAW